MRLLALLVLASEARGDDKAAAANSEWVASVVEAAAVSTTPWFAPPSWCARSSVVKFFEVRVGTTVEATMQAASRSPSCAHRRGWAGARRPRC